MHSPLDMVESGKGEANSIWEIRKGRYVTPNFITMKWNIITHNIRGLNDPESISKERCFLTNLTPKVDVVMIQEHKLRGKSMKNLGNKLMPGCASWILEAASGEEVGLTQMLPEKGEWVFY